MSMTYANANTEARTEETFVPRYARNTKAKKSVKTWMILAPIGAVVLLGSGVAMMMGGGEQAAPATSTEAEAPAMQTAPAAMTAAETPVMPAAPMETASAPAAAPTPAAPAPVARRAEPRAEPVARRAAPAAERPAAARVETPAVPTGPQPYAAPSVPEVSTSQLNTAPAAASTPAPVATPAQPAAPAITVQPLN